MKRIRTTTLVSLVLAFGALVAAAVLLACPPPQKILEDIITGTIKTFGRNLFGIPAEISNESIDDLVHAMLTGEEIDVQQLIKKSPELAAQFANVQGMPDVSQLTQLQIGVPTGKLALKAPELPLQGDEGCPTLTGSLSFITIPSTNIRIPNLAEPVSVTVDFGVGCTTQQGVDASGSVILSIQDAGFSTNLLTFTISGDLGFQFDSLIADGSQVDGSLSIEGNHTFSLLSLPNPTVTDNIINSDLSITEDDNTIQVIATDAHFRIENPATDPSFTIEGDMELNGKTKFLAQSGATVTIDADHFTIHAETPEADNVRITLQDNGTPDDNGIATSFTVEKGDVAAIFSIANMVIEYDNSETIINGTGKVAVKDRGAADYTIANVIVDATTGCQFPISGTITLTNAGGDTAVIEFTEQCGIANLTINDEDRGTINLGGVIETESEQEEVE